MQDRLPQHREGGPREPLEPAQDLARGPVTQNQRQVAVGVFDADVQRRDGKSGAQGEDDRKGSTVSASDAATIDRTAFKDPPGKAIRRSFRPASLPPPWGAGWEGATADARYSPDPNLPPPAPGAEPRPPREGWRAP